MTRTDRTPQIEPMVWKVSMLRLFQLLDDPAEVIENNGGFGGTIDRSVESARHRGIATIGSVQLVEKRTIVTPFLVQFVEKLAIVVNGFRELGLEMDVLVAEFGDALINEARLFRLVIRSDGRAAFQIVDHVESLPKAGVRDNQGRGFPILRDAGIFGNVLAPAEFINCHASCPFSKPYDFVFD